MNEHEISIHVNNSRIQIVQPEFTTWKYKVKLSAEAASGGVLFVKAVRKNFEIFIGKHLCWSLFLIKSKAFRS